MSITSDSDGSGLLLSVYVTFPEENVFKNKYVEYFLPKGLSINHVTWSNGQGVRQKVTLGHVDM